MTSGTGTGLRRGAATVLAVLAVAGCVAAVLGPPVAGAAPTRCFLVGAVVAVGSGLVVLAGRRLAGAAPPAVPAATVVGVLIVARGASWFWFAASAATGPFGVPSGGDAVNPVTGFLAIAAALSAVPARRPPGTRLLLLEVAMTTATTLLALYVLVVGPVVDVAGWTGPTVWASALTTVFVVQLVTGVVVYGASGVRRTGPTIVALTLITAGDLAGLLTGLDGDRHVPALALVAWCAGWPLLAWRALTVRANDAPPLEPRDREAGSTLVLAVAGLGVLAAIAGWATRRATTPDDLLAAALMLASLGTFVVHEWVVGRDRLRLVDDLADQAQRDPWTGLTNRRGLSDRIRALPPGSEWAVLAVDLDGFKAVNDVHGHARGDSVLAEVADVLRAHCPRDGVAARTGGDEFAMLVPGDVERGREIGRAVVDAVPRALAPLRLAVPITASVGVGRLVPVAAAVRRRAAEGGDADPLTPLVEAAAALRAAKAGGRNRVQVYPGHVARLRERRLLVEQRLREGLAQGALTSVGQPLVDLGTGRLHGIEALARWHDPVLGQVPPSEFVAVAEESGLIGDLGVLVLRSALAGFSANGFVGTPVLLGVNASPIQLRDAGFPECVRASAAAAGVPTRSLVVEVTEAVLVEDDDPALRVLGALAGMGVRVAIDDFGSGYSALGYLRRLPVQSVKLDRSLLVEARTTVRTRHVLAGLVDLAGRLGVTVVVEGVEDEYGARLAREIGARYGQGYRLGAPTDWADLAARYGTRATSPVELTRSEQPFGDESSRTITQ